MSFFPWFNGMVTFAALLPYSWAILDMTLCRDQPDLALSAVAG